MINHRDAAAYGYDLSGIHFRDFIVLHDIMNMSRVSSSRLIRGAYRPPRLLLVINHASPAKGVPNPEPSATADKLFIDAAAPDMVLGPISVLRTAGLILMHGGQASRIFTTTHITNFTP